MKSQSSTTIELKAGERIDDLQRNGYGIIQNPEKFCFGMDAVLLSGFCRIGPEEQVLDIGTGTGIIPILLQAKGKGEHFTGIEIQEESADMARRSVAMNGLEEKIDIVEGDIKEALNLFKLSSFDVITCNPPYMTGGTGIVNPADAKAIARHEVLCTFRDVAAQAEKLLKTGGSLFIVHRPNRLSELCVTLTEFHLEPKRMRLVYPYAEKEAEMVLIEAVRRGKRGMRMEKPLIIFDEDGNYTSEIKRDYGF